jgi:hypothetical protein
MPNQNQQQFCVIEILPPMPLLDITIPHLPETILSGELINLKLMVRNKGERGMKNFKVKLSHPAFFWFGNDEGLVVTSESDKSIGMSATYLK